MPDDSHKQMIYDVMRTRRMQRGDKAFGEVTSVADSAADLGHYFTAGYLWSGAADTAWGNPDRMRKAIDQAAEYYERALHQAEPCSPLSLATRVKKAKLYLHAVFDRDVPGGTGGVPRCVVRDR